MAEKRVDGWARWEVCEHTQGEEALARLAREAPRFFGASTFVGGKRADLSFYDTHELLELDFERDHGVARAFVLHGPTRTWWLNGDSAPIHEVNELEELALTDLTVADYLRFFVYFLRADYGGFVLVESSDEVLPDDVDAAPSADALTVEEVRQLARPVTPRADGDGEGRWLFDGTVAYNGSLFRASFAVEPDGTVEMTDDDEIGTLASVSVPEAPSLELVEQRGNEAPSDREITEVVVSVLLEDAIREMNGARADNMLLRHFNEETHADRPGTAIEQLNRLVEGSQPVVIIESEVPFVEDFVAGLVTPARVTSGDVGRATAMAGDDLRCEVGVRDGISVYLLSFHAYRGLFDGERVAHELSVSDATVLVGCSRVQDVPEPLRRITDLVITFPHIDARLFERIFERVFEAKPSEGWAVAGADWTRFLVPADFHTPRRLDMKPDDAQQFLRERVQHRLLQVSPDDGPRLGELQGMGEARQIAEDLITDIRAAQAGEIPWSVVDRGFLLIGAPGTGKTTLARAIAKECGVKFVVASASSWQSAGYLDAHLRAMRADFDEARRYAPSILFLDEIDSIGSREHLEGSNAQYQTDVINALLEEIQGVSTSDSVIVIGATNYLEKVDPALRRAGRLDQVVQIPLPNVDSLEQIFTYHVARFRADGGDVAADVDSRALAGLAFGLTGADVEFFVRGAARRARRESRPLSQADLVAEVTGRPRRPDSAPRLDPEEMKRVAVHEAGHTVARLTSSSRGKDLTFASIIPRPDGTLGFVASLPADTQVMTRRTMLEQLETVLGGRAAEEVVFGADNVGAGAGGPDVSSDLAVATRMATVVICQSGLGEGSSLQWTATASAEQLRLVDDLLRKSYSRIVARLETQRELLDRVAEALERKQELDGAELRQLVEPVTRPAGRSRAGAADGR